MRVTAVETAAEEAAVERLVDGLFLLVEPAGADGDVGAVVDCGDEALGFFDGGGEVGVGEHDDFAGGLEEAVADGVAFAAVAGILDEVEAGVRGHPLLDDGGGVIGGTVVDYEDVGVPGAGIHAAENAGEGGFDARALVIGGDDDAEARRSHGVEWRPDPWWGNSMRCPLQVVGGWHGSQLEPAAGSRQRRCTGILSPGRLPSYDICSTAARAGSLRKYVRRVWRCAGTLAGCNW